MKTRGGSDREAFQTHARPADMSIPVIVLLSVKQVKTAKGKRSSVHKRTLYKEYDTGMCSYKLITIARVIAVATTLENKSENYVNMELDVGCTMNGK